MVLLDIRRVEDLKSCVRNAQEGHTAQSNVALRTMRSGNYIGRVA